jgi:hypothetical protein
MAKDGSIRRWIRILYDAASGKKAEAQLAAGLGDAGKKGGTEFARQAKQAFEKRMADLKVAVAKGTVSVPEFKKQADAAARVFNSSILAGMQDARKAGKLTDTEYLKLSRTLKRVGDDGQQAGGKIFGSFTRAAAGIAGFLAANFGIRQFARFLSDSVKAALEAEDSVTRLDSVLRPLGLSYAAVSGDVEKLFDRIQKTTRFSDEDAREAMVNLVTATGDYQLSLRLLDLAAKIAEKRHSTMAEAAQTAADASRGLTKGMKDLGISAKDTGDIVAKIDKNLGNLAEEGAQKGSGAIARMNNLWGEFKEKIGAAILGSDGLKSSLGQQGLLGALVSLNEWADQNSGAISSFIDKLFSLIRAGQEVGKFWIKFVPNLMMVSKAIDKLRGKQDFGDVEVAGSSTAPPPKPGGGGGGGIADPDATSRRAAEVERINTELAIKTMQLERGLTEEQAREEVRRETIKRGSVQKIVSTVEEGWARLAQLDAKLALSLDTTLTPAVVRTTDAVGKLVDRTDALVKQIEKIRNAPPPKPTTLTREEMADQLDKEQAEIAARAADHAQLWQTPWTHALDIVENEIKGKGTLFQQLGQAWAEGGISGLAQYAATKAKENTAHAIEQAAKALGSLFGFNPGAALAHGAAAAKHTAAAIAWGELAGSSKKPDTSTAAAGLGGTPPAGLGRSSSMEKAPPEVHIHFKGSSFFIPEVQKAIYASQIEARERYGQNAKIIVHRDHRHGSTDSGNRRRSNAR